MLLSLHSQQFTLTPSIRDFVVENLQEPLEHIWSRAGGELDVHLRDLRGGDKQGVDKECRAVFYMPRGPQFVITEITEDMRTSIHQARKRLARRIRQYVEQRFLGARHTHGHRRVQVIRDVAKMEKPS